MSHGNLPRLAPGYLGLRRLGAGRITEVILATDPSGRRVAVKQLKPDFCRHPGAQAALRHEHAVLSQVQGTGVVKLLGWLDAAPGGGLALEHLACGDLLPLICAPFSTWRRPLAELAGALHALHQQGWAHRDVRPENALFRAPSVAVWIDFAAAGRLGQATSFRGPGTHGYMSPQQRAGLKASSQDDVYSFGALARQLVTGELPALSPTAETSLAGRPGKAQDVPPSLLAWIVAALAETRSARPADLRSVAQLLEDIDDHG